MNSNEWYFYEQMRLNENEQYLKSMNESEWYLQYMNESWQYYNMHIFKT
jgi:hypothetical protein